MCSLLGVPPGSRSQGRKIVDTAPTPATAVRLRPLVVFRANRSSPTIEVSSPTTPMTLSDHKAIQQEESSASLLPRKLVWHRREALSFFFFSLPFGRGAMLSAGKRWLVHASQPHLPIHALFSVPSVLAYNTREAPCSSLGAENGTQRAHK